MRMLFSVFVSSDSPAPCWGSLMRACQFWLLSHRYVLLFTTSESSSDVRLAFSRKFQNTPASITWIIPYAQLCLFPCFSFSWVLKLSTWWDSAKRFCELCDCSPLGSVSPQCDMTGRCICKSGFVGKQCNLRRQVHHPEEQPHRAQRVLGSPRMWGSSGSRGCPRGTYWTPVPVGTAWLCGHAISWAVAEEAWKPFAE